MVQYQRWRNASRQMRRIGCEVRDTRVDRTTCTLHQSREAVTPKRFRGGFKHKPQLFLDRVFELAATRAFVRVSLHTSESRESRP